MAGTTTGTCCTSSVAYVSRPSDVLRRFQMSFPRQSTCRACSALIPAGHVFTNSREYRFA